MEEIEPPMENVNEDIHEHAHHAAESWISWVAMSTAVLAAIAAVTALLSGSHANEAMMLQVQAADKWNEGQGNSIKLSLRESKVDILKALGKEAGKSDEEKIAKYSLEKEKLFDEARHIEMEAHENFETHETYAKGVTLFQIAITIAAIAVLSKKKMFWFLGLAFGIVGLYFFSKGMTVDVPVWLHGAAEAKH